MQPPPGRTHEDAEFEGVVIERALDPVMHYWTL